LKLERIRLRSPLVHVTGKGIPHHEPVSMLSFTIQSPDSKIQSQGTWVREGSENSNTSPGTSSSEVTDLPGHNKHQRTRCYGVLTKAVSKNPDIALEMGHFLQTVHSLIRL
jgi:hypothetical protein